MIWLLIAHLTFNGRDVPLAMTDRAYMRQDACEVMRAALTQTTPSIDYECIRMQVVE